MIINDKSSFTSEPFSIEQRASLDMCLAITGPGPVALERLGEDRVWRGFPELTFSGPTIQTLELPRGQYRVVISGGPTTVEVR